MNQHASRKKILIIYDYFSPAYKAGGPVRSLVNMVGLLAQKYAFYVVTRNEDLDGTVLDVEPDQWIDFEGKARVFYASRKNTSFGKVNALIRDVAPDVVYINGLFSPYATVIPLLGNVWFRSTARYVVAPRGMFQAGALALKATKKRVFLSLMKPLMRRNNVAWHATDTQEQQDIYKHIGPKAHIVVAGNVPALPQNKMVEMPDGSALRFVTVALVVKMKNHIAFLEVLKQYTGERKIVYDIFGPIKDQDYWQECQQLIDQMPENVKVTYQGAVAPSQVPDVLARYHFFVLPTFGENFGHSIFEALAMGLPILISDKTPWNHVQEQQAGWVVADNNRDDWHKAFNEAIDQTPQQWQQMSKNARLVAENYLKEARLEEKYEALLGQ
ncbi:glycosyltransferase family 4 protein [Thermophagus sp. OGC60D27]|uniref:glycosyltransferase family 4 protein n=1 Tax=Thermophagus sp. OGC60D27 TaxID=3458415 RepID=UPI004037ACF8